MRIGIDLDDVLANFIQTLIGFHNETYNTHLSLDTFYSIYYWEVWGGTREEAIKKVYQFHQSGYSKQIQPIEGAIKSIQELSKKHELFIITSRQTDFEKLTRTWLDQYFPGMFKTVFFTNHYDLTGSIKPVKQKFKVCLENHISVMIEDSPEHAVQFIRSPVILLLFDSPWNKSVQNNSNIIRVSGWKNTVKTVRNL